MTNDIGPEDKAKERLTTWLQKYGASVYWEKKNDSGYPTFHIDSDDDTAEKPDLVIQFDGACFAVEVKHGYSNAGVYDAANQIQRYWLKHAIRGQEYICDGEKAGIDAFLTATRHSKEGRLFSTDVEVLLTEQWFSDNRIEVIDRGWIPPTEYSMTEQHVRTLWRLAKSAIENGHAAESGIGSLLSTELEEDAQPPAPAVLWSEPTSGGWLQHWDTYADRGQTTLLTGGGSQ